MKSLDFLRAAAVITDHVLGIQPSEEVLIITDTRIGEFPGAEALVQAVATSVASKGADLQIATFVPRQVAGMEPPKAIAAAMKSADAVVIMSTLSILQTVATTEAIASGTRVVMLPPARYIYNSLDMLYRLMPVDPKEVDDMIGLAKKIATLFGEGKQIKISTPKGTDITLGIGELRVVHSPSTARKPGERTIIPGGQAAVGVAPGQAEGRFVVDASASPLYRILSDPIEIEVSEGKVTRIEGGKDAQDYRELLRSLDDPQVYLIAEVGVGINPRAELSGTPLEDERILGASWIAVGTNVHLGGTVKAKLHSDCVMLPPLSLWVDDKLVLRDREYLI